MPCPSQRRPKVGSSASGATTWTTWTSSSPAPTVSAVASTQRRHTNRLDERQQALDLQTGRLDRIEDTQRQMLDTQHQIIELLRDAKPTPGGASEPQEAD